MSTKIQNPGKETLKKMVKNLQMLEIEKLIPYEKNSRVHRQEQIDQIIKSIEEFGFNNPILISQENGIIAGHGRLMAAKKLKMTKVPVICLDHLTPEQQRAYIIADNKIAENSSWDMPILAEEIQALNNLDFDVSLLGFSDKDLDDLLKMQIEEIEDEEEDNSIPELTKANKTKPGDIWLLDKHRLICGSCQDIETYKKVTLDKKIDMLLTDPPYGVDYEAKREDMNRRAGNGGGVKHKHIANDKHEDYRKFFSDFLSIINFNNYNTIYCFLSGQELHNLRLAFEDCNIKWGDYLIWLKNCMVMNRKDYNAKHEFIVYGWKGTHKFFGPKNATTILEFNRPTKADLHPTMKPIDLVEELLSHGSQRNMIVYEPFCGSGTTLIACENKGRICYAIELEPAYCDVIVKRWQDLTGKKAILESTNQTFDEVIATDG